MELKDNYIVIGDLTPDIINYKGSLLTNFELVEKMVKSQQQVKIRQDKSLIKFYSIFRLNSYCKVVFIPDNYLYFIRYSNNKLIFEGNRFLEVLTRNLFFKLGSKKTKRYISERYLEITKDDDNIYYVNLELMDIETNLYTIDTDDLDKFIKYLNTSLYTKDTLNPYTLDLYCTEETIEDLSGYNPLID